MLLRENPAICTVFRPNTDESVKNFFGARTRRFSVHCRPRVETMSHALIVRIIPLSDLRGFCNHCVGKTATALRGQPSVQAIFNIVGEFVPKPKLAAKLRDNIAFHSASDWPVCCSIFRCCVHSTERNAPRFLRPPFSFFSRLVIDDNPRAVWHPSQ